MFTQGAKCFLLAVILTGLVTMAGLLGVGGVYGCAGPAESNTIFPATCLEMQDLVVDTTGSRPSDGLYTLYLDGEETQPWEAYCYNMNRTEPLEYLTVSEDINFSQITTDDGSMAETTYRRYRIDPVRLEIDPLDDTFSTTDIDDNFTPSFPVDGSDFVPAGWAEVQSSAFNADPGAEASVSLADTAFVFNDSILAGNQSVFFCQVDSAGFTFDTTGTGVDVTNGNSAFMLTAVNTNSSPGTSISTREVADCENLGTGVTDFTSGAWPLDYVGL